MIEEQATVTAVDDGYAWVQTSRSTACDSCAAQKGCGTSAIGKVIGRQYTEVRALNRCNASIGDTVIVGLAEDMLLKSSLAVYLVPLLLMLAGAMTGELLLGGSFAAVAGCGAGLVAGFAWIQWFSARIARNERFQPTVLRTTTTARPEFKVTLTP